MDRRLLQPRWLLAHTIVILVAVLFVSLGFWQLRRLEERRIENEVGLTRLSAASVELDVLASSEGEPASLQFRRVTVTGTYDPTQEILIRSQVHLGTAGFHVITPLVGERGEAVLVNRGWIPLTMDQVPAGAAPPQQGEVTVEGWVELSQTRPPLGREDPPEGRLTVMNRVDIDRIQQQVTMPLEPFYIVRIGEQGSELPFPVRQPRFDEEGPHLGYAIQWFGFALVGLVGYYFLARKRLGQSVPTE